MENQQLVTAETEKQPRNNRTLWIILAVVGIILCCCCITLSVGGSAFLNWVRQVASESDKTPVSSPYAPNIGTPTPRVPRLTATPTQATTPASDATTQPLDSTETERALTEMNVPQRDLRTLAMQLRPEVGEIPATVNPTPPSYNVGDVITFTVSNTDDNRHFQINAELRYKTAHLYMWIEKGAKVEDSALQKSADLFEAKTYPTNREFFGSEWTPGVDNDVRLHILHARGLGRTVAGYYSSADEFSRKAQSHSNEKEMFYINLDNNEPGTDFYDGTLAHEFQHMIHWNNDRNEETWVNEGSSELASYLNGFDPGGSENAFLETPDTQLTTWGSEPGSNAPHYGSAYLFMSYFLEQFGEEATRALVASPLNGKASFDDVLQKFSTGETFDSVFADWVVANLLDDDTNANGRYGYKAVDLETITLEQKLRRYPAIVDQATVSQYAADYFELAGSGDVTIDFSGNTSTGLVNTNAHSGSYAWWGNREDDSDATLTREFDLSSTSSATLNFWTWYQIEKDFDYAYVETSTDTGKTWKILPGKNTTNENPNGNSFGPAFTGNSGGGDKPAWVQETIDLSAYAGQKVLVRFQYITDDAVTQPGILIDDVQIPEINYDSDAENSDETWQSQGWIRTNNKLAQRWLVQVVEKDRLGIDVSVMEVDASGHGSLNINAIGNNGRQAYIVVSAIAPVTSEQGTYNLEVRKQ